MLQREKKKNSVYKTNLAGKKQVRIWILNHNTVIFFPWTPFEKENQPIDRPENKREFKNNLNHQTVIQPNIYSVGRKQRYSDTVIQELTSDC